MSALLLSSRLLSRREATCLGLVPSLMPVLSARLYNRIRTQPNNLTTYIHGPNHIQQICVLCVCVCVCVCVGVGVGGCTKDWWNKWFSQNRLVLSFPVQSGSQEEVEGRKLDTHIDPIEQSCTAHTSPTHTDPTECVMHTQNGSRCMRKQPYLSDFFLRLSFAPQCQTQ